MMTQIEGARDKLPDTCTKKIFLSLYLTSLDYTLDYYEKVINLLQAVEEAMASQTLAGSKSEAHASVPTVHTCCDRCCTIHLVFKHNTIIAYAN